MNATQETCQAHEFYGRLKKCESTHIHVDLMKDGKRYPICGECWVKIAESELEWSA